MLAIFSAGLPDIQGKISVPYGDNPALTTGAFENAGARHASFTGGEANITQVKFIASNSNVIYGASNTVQPPSISLVPQIKY